MAKDRAIRPLIYDEEQTTENSRAVGRSVAEADRERRRKIN